MIQKLFETKIENDIGVYYFDDQTKNVCGIKKVDFLDKFEKIGGQ